MRGSLHHLELWVESLPDAEASWGWLLRELVAADASDGEVRAGSGSA